MRPEKILQILRQCNNWRDFKRCLEPLEKKEMGDCFEALTLYYLKLNDTHRVFLKNVWLLRDVPRKVLGQEMLLVADLDPELATHAFVRENTLDMSKGLAEGEPQVGGPFTA